MSEGGVTPEEAGVVETTRPIEQEAFDLYNQLKDSLSNIDSFREAVVRNKLDVEGSGLDRLLANVQNDPETQAQAVNAADQLLQTISKSKPLQQTAVEEFFDPKPGVRTSMGEVTFQLPGDEGVYKVEVGRRTIAKHSKETDDYEKHEGYRLNLSHRKMVGSGEEAEFDEDFRLKSEFQLGKQPDPTEMFVSTEHAIDGDQTASVDPKIIIPTARAEIAKLQQAASTPPAPAT